ncbi:MAG: hypothetical protein EAX87_14015 [Candidatus Thorarchaeota archaeon]|nr:hypothetical protein [Candidatus Thorarchaeota archaeon]
MSGTVRIEGDDVVLEIHGIDEILSIKRSIHIPFKHIVSVSTETIPWNIFNAIKLAGTNIPHHVKDGRFLTKEGMMFFEMHDPDSCITISLDHERYKKIFFEVEDKESAATLIEDAMSSEKLIHSNDESVSEMSGK